MSRRSNRSQHSIQNTAYKILNYEVTCADVAYNFFTYIASILLIDKKQHVLQQPNALRIYSLP